MGLGRLVAELIHDQEDEVAEHQVDHRTGTGHRRADGNAHEAGFGNRRIDNPRRSEFLDKAGKNLEGGSSLGHVLADDEHGLVAAHFFGEGLIDGLGKGDFTHGVSPQAA
jgi:hypothetical protein